jgi:hypothetical protein
VFRQKLQLTSKYSWVYGGWRNVFDDQWSNDPSVGSPHHFFDEARALIGPIAQGSKVHLQKDASDSAGFYVLDLVDLEQVAPAITQPNGSLSITQFGAIADDGIDDAAAIQATINAAVAQNKTVYIPPGTFEDASAQLTLSDVSIQGAGMWYSTVHGAKATFLCTSNRCQYRDFAILGETTSRNDGTTDNGFQGGAGQGSLLENIWIEHTKVGYWVGGGGLRTDGLQIRGCRVRNTFADGINLLDGTHDSVIEQTNVRNTGDDGLAAWSPAPGPPDANNVFRFNTVQAPWFANGMAIYGGNDNHMEDDVVSDVVTSSGVLIAQDFGSNPFGGMTTLERTSLARCGGGIFGGEHGAIKLGANQAAMHGFIIRDVEAWDSTFSGIEIGGPNAIDTTYFQSVLVEGAGTHGIELDADAHGAADFNFVFVTRAAQGGLGGGGSFEVKRGSGDSF